MWHCTMDVMAYPNEVVTFSLCCGDELIERTMTASREVSDLTTSFETSTQEGSWSRLNKLQRIMSGTTALPHCCGLGVCTYAAVDDEVCSPQLRLVRGRVMVTGYDAPSLLSQDPDSTSVQTFTSEAAEPSYASLTAPYSLLPAVQSVPLSFTRFDGTFHFAKPILHRAFNSGLRRQNHGGSVRYLSRGGIWGLEVVRRTMFLIL